jgi:hypothetical protein
MRLSLALALTILAAATASRAARGSPDRLEATEVRGGFSKGLAASTLPATLPRAVQTTSPFAGIRINAEVGAD